MPLNRGPKLAFTVVQRWRIPSKVAAPPRSSPNSFWLVAGGAGSFADTAATRVGGKGTAALVGVSAFDAGAAIGGGVVGAAGEAFAAADGAVVAGALGAGGVVFAARAAAVAAACRLMAPVMSSMLLSRSAILPASRSRSTVSARTCAVRRSTSELKLGHAWRHLCDGGGLVNGKDLAQAVARSFGLACNRQSGQSDCRSASPAAQPQKRVEFTAAPARLAQIGFQRRLFSRHTAPRWGESLKTLAESGKSCLLPAELTRIRRWSFADALARLWDAHKSSESVSQDGCHDEHVLPSCSRPARARACGRRSRRHCMSSAGSRCLRT